MPDAIMHPSLQELSDFGLGRLPEAAAATVAEHLETCATCQKAVAELPPDSFLGKVRASRPNPASIPAGQQAAPAKMTVPPEGLPPELANYPKYRFVRELGRGGMGVVYLAEQTLMDRRVAVKVINPGVLDHPDALPRFHAEVRAAAKLDHPNIVRAYDAEQVGGLHLLVMEFVEGTNLADLVQRKGPLPIAHACHFIRQAALGLRHAFEQGMIHRDIKPHNLMVTPKGQVKILDFGLARLRSSGGRGLTEVGSFMGTPEYVAPEQATDAHTADTRADLYSLGCTLYFLLTGRPPFVEDTAVKVILAQIEKQAPSVQELRPEVPAELSAVVARLLAKDPAQRFQTPVELARALVPFIKQGTKREAVSLPPLAMPVSDRGTVLGGNTSKVIKRQENPAGQASVPPAASLADLVEPGSPPEKSVRPAKEAPAAWYRRRPLQGGAAAAVLALGLGIWLVAGVILKVPTKDGILVIEVNEPNPTVSVDGESVAITWDKEGKKAEVHVAVGTHQVEVKKDGFTVRGDEAVTLEEGGRKVLTVTLEKTPGPRPGMPGVGTPPPAQSDGFTPLFNGKDLTGWKSLANSKAKWEVKDGVLIGNGDKGYLFSDPASYENFHLRVEAMINDGGNSGVYFRAPFGPTTPQGDPALGNEAQINITHRDPRKTGSLFVAGKAAVGLPNTPTEVDQWFTLEIIADGQHHTVKVNGKVTADYIELAIGSRSGRLALQVLDAATAVKFRKIEIKELPPGELRLQYPHGQGVFEQVKGNVWLERRGNWLGYWREHHRDNVQDGGGTVRLNRKIEDNQTGILHITRGNGAWWNVQGTRRWTRIFSGHWAVLPRRPLPEKSHAARVGEWVPLLNGKDLSGWETGGNDNATWTYEGSALVGRSNTGPAGVLLSRRTDYENFHLRMEARLSEGTYSSLFVRCGPPSDGTAGNKCYAIRVGEASTAAPVTGALVLSAHLDEVVPLELANAAKEPLKPDEWFPLEVLAEGNHLRVLVNGKTVVDHTDANETFAAGRLGLVCRPNGLVRFRKLEIKELSPGKP